MSHFPDFETFSQLARQGNIVPVYRKLVSDTLTPVSAYCKIAQGDHSFLFESVIGGEKIGRYSFVGSNPFLELEAFETRVVIREGGRSTEFESPDPLADLQKQLDMFQGVHLPGLPRFCG
ncbi:MAG: anthranilate synthase component I, partial [Planctomycetaceae bacterium]|nr:anthranilate synthase component I [Planctomycetaceae bacterium]